MEIEISRRQIRGKALDDDCKTAKISRNEYGVHDKRCFCYGLIDCSTEDYLGKCVKCRAFVNNAKPLLVGEMERISDKRLNSMIEALSGESDWHIYVSDCVSVLLELKERRQAEQSENAGELETKTVSDLEKLTGQKWGRE